MSYSRHFSTRVTPQNESIPDKTQVENNAGGFVFEIDKWKQLDRFLILGCTGGSYYAGERELTIDNGKIVLECLAEDASRAIGRIVEISESGRAPRNNEAIFALAIAAGQHHVPLIRELNALNKVCRIGTHLFQFVRDVKAFRGWGRGLRSLVAGWYTSKDADSLAYQLAKYQSRDKMSHRVVLKLSHPKSDDKGVRAAMRWATAGADNLGERLIKRTNKTAVYYEAQLGVADDMPTLLAGYEEIKATDKTDVKTAVRLIEEYKLPRECVPTEFLNRVEVWETLLPHMKPEATLRNLGKMTAIGMLKPLSVAAKLVCDRIGDAEAIKRARLHPISILKAIKIYEQGCGDKGKLTWTPVQTVNDALDAAFYLSFRNIEPTGKPTLLALDVSGSMGWESIAGSPLTAREGAAAMAMVTARTESNYAIMAFSDRFVPLDITATSRLADVIQKTGSIPFGRTDCALPMLWATNNKLNVETFATYTDNETWFGAVHPCQALREFREKLGLNARNIVVGMTATKFTIADPADPHSLDVVGFDTATPGIIADFAAGRI